MQRQNNIVDKPRAVNALLHIPGQTIDLNSIGLINLSFSRYKGNLKNANTSIISDIDMTFYDESGNDLMKILQQTKGKLRFQYGFEENELSPIYNLTVLKYVGTYQEQGPAVALGGIGEQVDRKFPAEVYKVGTPIKIILEEMARRNNWIPYIDCNLHTPTPLAKSANITDAYFIQESLIPIANKSILPGNIDLANQIMYEMILYDNGTQKELHFRPSTTRGATRRLWTYNYGTSTRDNNIIELKNTVDMTFLLQGLTIEVHSDDFEIAINNDESFQKEAEKIIADLSKDIQALIEKYNILMLSVDTMKYEVKLVQAEDIGNKTLKDRILEAVDRAMSVVNTAELTIVGNPHIQPTDLVKLVVKNKDNTNNFLTSPSNTNSYWRVIGIEENISNSSGYTTELKLVRELITV